jgi:hypothetical protein
MLSRSYELGEIPYITYTYLVLRSVKNWVRFSYDN